MFENIGKLRFKFWLLWLKVVGITHAEVNLILLIGLMVLLHIFH